MARGRPRGETASAIRQVQQQARALLASLRKEIRSKESELRRLKSEETSLGRFTGFQRVIPAAPTGGSTRINWRSVLHRLPKQFKAADVRRNRGLREKRPSEIFAAITRWIKAGLVKRKSRGLYERA
jgi:hypothetical protein